MLSPLHPLQLAFGLTIWAIWFTVVYSAIGIACGSESYQDSSVINLGLVAFTVLVGGYLLWSSYRCRKTWNELRAQSDPNSLQLIGGRPYPAEFMASLAFGINLLSGMSTWLVGLPFVLFMPCIR